MSLKEKIELAEQQRKQGQALAREAQLAENTQRQQEALRLDQEEEAIRKALTERTQSLLAPFLHEVNEYFRGKGVVEVGAGNCQVTWNNIGDETYDRIKLSFHYERGNIVELESGGSRKSSSFDIQDSDFRNNIEEEIATRIANNETHHTPPTKSTYDLGMLT